MIDDTPDYPALHRMWPIREWFRFEDLPVAQHQDTGPRVAVIIGMVSIAEDQCTGEINA